MRTHINKDWHRKNQMPDNPTFEERIKWHTEHQKNCSCYTGKGEETYDSNKAKPVRNAIGLYTE